MSKLERRLELELPWGIQMRATLHTVHHAAHVQSSPITKS
jgi:hypothetical protein